MKTAAFYTAMAWAAGFVMSYMITEGVDLFLILVLICILIAFGFASKTVGTRLFPNFYSDISR